MKNTNIYAGYRYPSQITSHAVWLYHRFTLSFRDIEELLAASRFFRKLLKGQQAAPIKIVTDKLESYSAAKKELIPSLEHSTQQNENNRCELSHQPGRQQERQMRKFKSQGQAQRFLSCHGVVNNLFRLGRHSMKASHYRIFRDRAFVEWGRASCVQYLA
jgi:putative transposase